MGKKNKKRPLHKQKWRQYRFPGCPVGLSPSQRKRLVVQMLFKIQDGDCFYCGRRMTIPSTNQSKIKGLHATIDHIIPVSKGGMSDLNNVVLACADCNFRRGGRWINPVTKQGISLPLDFGRRWDFLTQGGEDEVGSQEAEVLGRGGEGALLPGLEGPEPTVLGGSHPLRRPGPRLVEPVCLERRVQVPQHEGSSDGCGLQDLSAGGAESLFEEIMGGSVKLTEPPQIVVN